MVTLVEFLIIYRHPVYWMQILYICTLFSIYSTSVFVCTCTQIPLYTTYTYVLMYMLYLKYELCEVHTYNVIYLPMLTCSACPTCTSQWFNCFYEYFLTICVSYDPVAVSLYVVSYSVVVSLYVVSYSVAVSLHVVFVW